MVLQAFQKQYQPYIPKRKYSSAWFIRYVTARSMCHTRISRLWWLIWRRFTVLFPDMTITVLAYHTGKDEDGEPADRIVAKTLNYWYYEKSRVILILDQPIDKLLAIISSFCVKLPWKAASLTAVAFQGQRSDLTGFILSVGFVYRTIEN